MNMERHEMNYGVVEMLAISEIYKAVSVFSVSSRGLVSQTPTVSFVFVLIWWRINSG
jgi:hypothetical protein